MSLIFILVAIPILGYYVQNWQNTKFKHRESNLREKVEREPEIRAIVKKWLAEWADKLQIQAEVGGREGSLV